MWNLERNRKGTVDYAFNRQFSDTFTSKLQTIHNSERDFLILQLDKCRMITIINNLYKIINKTSLPSHKGWNYEKFELISWQITTGNSVYTDKDIPLFFSLSDFLKNSCRRPSDWMFLLSNRARSWRISKFGPVQLKTYLEAFFKKISFSVSKLIWL